MAAARFLVALLLIAGLGACGGGEDADTGDWKKEVTAICEDTTAQVTDLAEEIAAEGAGQQAASAEVLERSVPLVEDQLDRLRDVEVPDDLSSDYEAFVDGVGEALPLFDDLADAVREGQQPDSRLTTEFARIAAETRPFATEHGLTACLADAS